MSRTTPARSAGPGSSPAWRAAERSWKQAIQRGADPQPPAPVDRGLRAAEPAGALLSGEPLRERDEDVRDVGRVAGEPSGGDGAPHAADDELAHRGAGAQLLR